MRIFGDSISGNCLKVKWTAAYLGLPGERVESDIMKGESRTPEFLAMNPAGQVPVIAFDDGRTLAQSNAILLHLARGSDLIPSDLYDEAKMLEWLFWEQYSHEPYVAVARFQVLYQKKPVAELDARLVERATAALVRLETALSDRTYLVGDAVTLADISLIAYTRMAPDGGFDLAAYPRIRQWIGAVERRLDIAPVA